MTGSGPMSDPNQMGRTLLSPADVVALCRTFVHSEIDGPLNRVSTARLSRVIDTIAVLSESGFPTDEPTQLRLSIIPFAFQEANYDGIDWCEREPAKLGPLATLFVIDFLVQMGGRRRQDAAAGEMETYRRRSFKALEVRKTCVP